MNNRSYQEEAQIELILAACIGNIDGALHALKSGADINGILPDANITIREPYQLSETDRKSSALHIAATYGHVDMVKFLLNNKANPNLPSNGNSPLITAVEAQNIDLTYLLLEHKADANQINRERKSAYEISLSNNNHELCNLLLSHGAKPVTLEQHIRKQIRDSLYPSLHYANIDTLDNICSFLITNFPENLALIYSELTRDNILRKCFPAAKDTSRCSDLLRLIDLFEESSQHFNTAALLPEKYTFANLNLKEDIFASIRTLPLQERIKKYNTILNHPDSSYYRIFHMKRGYIFGVSKTRGILHEISQAYANDQAELSRSQNTAPENSPIPAKKDSDPSVTPATTQIYPNAAALLLPGDEGVATTAPVKVESRLYPDLKQFHAPQSDGMQEYLHQAKPREVAVITPPVLLNPFTGEPLPFTKTDEPASDPLAAIDAILHAPAATKQPSWLAGLDEIDFSQTELSSTAVIMNQFDDLMSFEEPAKPYVNPFDELTEQEKQAVAAKPGYKNPFDDLTDEQHDAQVAAQLDALPKAPTGGIFSAVQKVSQSTTAESGERRIATLN